MNFTVNFTANEVFDAEDEIAVESFCQVLSRVGQDYLEKALDSFAPEKPRPTKEELALHKAKHKEIKQILWNAKGQVIGQDVSITFQIPEQSLVFQSKTKESVEAFLNKAFSLHWESEAVIRNNSVIDEVSAYLDTTEVHFHQTFKEALTKLKID